MYYYYTHQKLGEEDESFQLHELVQFRAIKNYFSPSAKHQWLLFGLPPLRPIITEGFFVFCFTFPLIDVVIFNIPAAWFLS